MFCVHCGAEIPDGVPICTNCGNPISEVVSDNTQSESKDQPAQSESKGQSTQPKSKGQSTQPKSKGKSTQSESKDQSTQPKSGSKKIWKKLLILVACGALLLGIALGVFMNSKPKIDLKKYLKVDSYGYDGYGDVTIDIDWKAIEKKYGDKIGVTKKADEEHLGPLADEEPVDILRNYVSVTTDKQSGLSNGDKIVYSINVNEEFADYVKCEVSSKRGDYRVSELEEITKFDPFDDLEVSFTGSAPDGELIYDYTGEDLNTSNFYPDVRSQLKNGDIVTISIDENIKDSCAQSLGKIPSKFTMEYTVEGLTQYVDSYDELSEPFLEILYSEAEDTIYAYTASNYDENTKLTNLIYSGYIMNMANDDSNTNNLYIVYTGNVSGHTVYYPVEFQNILKTDAEFTYQENGGIIGRYSLETSPSEESGYLSSLDCYLDIVGNNKEEYTSLLGGYFESYSSCIPVTKFDEVSDTFAQTLQKEDKKLIDSYIENNYDDTVTSSAVNYVGAYLLNAKDKDATIGEKSVYITVYSSTLSHQDKLFNPTTVYYPITHTGMMLLANDDNVAQYNNAGILGNSTLEGDGNYTTKGYIDGTAMYNELITSHRDRFIYQVSDALQQFGR